MSYRLNVVRAVLSGSYKRDVENLQKTYDELVTTGCQILSPHSLAFVNSDHGFQRTVQEQRRSAEELERHHLFSIAEADFVWLHAPNGYIGTSTAMEIGFAIASETPVFCRSDIEDPAIAPFITMRNSVFEAIYQLES